MMSQNNSGSKIRVRFAPSPTGYLHVGGARTALYNYLYAKRNGGTFILRIEDTDEERSTEESLRMVVSDLTWLGIQWDEGPDAKTLKDHGSFGPYRQSQRKKIYAEVAEQLLASGKAYYCFMTDEEIESQRQDFIAKGLSPHIDSPYQNWTLEQARKKLSEGGKATVRFRTKQLKRDYILQDLIRGEIKFPSDMVGDFVLLRSDGMPVYNFCCVVDDHQMQMTHILRAEEHLPNTLRQLMIFEAMGWERPAFGHISLVLDEDRQKLSKRRGATSCHQFQEEGYLPEAINNFIALLGWSHPESKEVLSLQEMKDTFSLDRLHVSGAVFDRVKLKWMNSQHLRATPNDKLWKLLEPFLVDQGVSFHKDSTWQAQSLEAFKPKMETLKEAVELYKNLDDQFFELAPDAGEILSWPTSKTVIDDWLKKLKALPVDKVTEADFVKMQDEVKVSSQTKGKNLFQPMRVAVIGKPHGTELNILVPLLSKMSLIDRAEKVLKSMK